MADDWREYQEETAEFFRSLGLTAETDVTLTGVRTTHDVDVVVRSKHVGFEVLWLVECKHWKSPVTKLHVLGLREIVSDLGAWTRTSFTRWTPCQAVVSILPKPTGSTSRLTDSPKG